MEFKLFFFYFNIIKCLVFGCCCWLAAQLQYPLDFDSPQSIESRLKLILPEDLGPFLMDGVVLCHLANHLHPCSVAGIHVPSPAAVGLLLSVWQWMPPYASIFTDCLCFQPKLGMAKCRRNVENFLEACRKQGVPEVRPPSFLLFQCSYSLFLLSTGDLFLVCFHLWYSPQWTFVNLRHESVMTISSLSS